MKAQKSLQSLIATAVISAILVGCSGGGTDESTNTIPRASTTPTSGGTKTPTPVSPTIGSGPITVGMSGDESMDEINGKLDEIKAGQAAQNSMLNEINGNASDAKSNSKWAKIMGFAAVGMLGLAALYNGYRVGKATGSFWKGLGGFAVSNDSEADEVYDQKREDTALAANKKNVTAGMKWSYGMGDRGRKAAVGAVNGRMDDFENKYDKIEEEKAKRIVKTGEDVEDVKKVADATHKAVQQGNSDRSQFQDKTSTTLEKINKATGNVEKTLEGRMKELEKEIADRDTLIKQANDTIAEQKLKAQEKQGEINSLNERIKGFDAQKEEDKKQIASLTEQKTKAEAEMNTLTSAVKSNENGIKAITEERTFLAAQLANQKKASELFAHFIFDTKDKLADKKLADGERAALNTQIEKMGELSSDHAIAGRMVLDFINP